MGKTSIGLDIGLNSVKLVELTTDARGMVRLSRAAVHYTDFNIDMPKEQRAQEIASLLRKEKEFNKTAAKKNIVVALPSNSVFVRYIDVLETKRKKESELVELEARQQIPFPIDEVAWDYTLTSDPEISMKRAILLAVKRDLVNENTEILAKANFQSTNVTLSLFSLLNTVRYNAELSRKDIMVIVDIGTDSTGILINCGRHVWLRSFSLGGRKITESIAENAGIDLMQAEMSKKEGAEGIEKLDKEIQAKITKALTFDLESLVGEVERSINFYKMDYLQKEGTGKSDTIEVSRIILSGGGSKIQGITGFFEQRLGIPVSIINAFERISVEKRALRKKQFEALRNSPRINEEIGPLFSVAIGAALQGLGKGDFEINFLKQELEVSKKTSVKKYFWAASYIIFIITFLVHFMFQRAELKIKEENLEKLTSTVEQINKYDPGIESLKKKVSLENDYGLFLLSFLQKRFLWLEVLNDITTVLPNNVWLTSFQASGAIRKEEVNSLRLQGVTVTYDELNTFISALKESSRIKEVKPESVVGQDDRFNFLLNLKVYEPGEWQEQKPSETEGT